MWDAQYPVLTPMPAEMETGDSVELDGADAGTVHHDNPASQPTPTPTLVSAPDPGAVWCSDGSNYGDMFVTDTKSILMTSLGTKPMINFSLENVAQCVIPSMNRNELEIQFNESDARKDEDSLVQITFHFPKNPVAEDSDEEEKEEMESKAESFQKAIMGTGAIDDSTGNILVEFSREEGNFVAPRSKFVVQVCS